MLKQNKLHWKIKANDKTVKFSCYTFWQVCILHDSYISALRFKVSSQLGKKENIHQKQTDVRPIAGPAASKS